MPSKGKQMISRVSSQPVARHSARPRAGLLGRFLLALATRRQHRRLLDLDDAMLRDIGVTRHEAWAEANRPFWDVPATWRR
jgi:uncharacterized protein YjiS (DUF1127 family)